MSKNDHFREMVTTASTRGFHPCFVMFDRWYSGIDNPKYISKRGWNWFSRIKKNRMVNPDDTDNRPVSDLEISDDGMTVHMKKYRFVRVFHTVNKDGKNRFWATNSSPGIIRTDGTSRPSAGQSRIITALSKNYVVSRTVRSEKKPANDTTSTVLSALSSALKQLTRLTISPSITPNGK